MVRGRRIDDLVGLSGHTLKTGLADFLANFNPKSAVSTTPQPTTPWRAEDRLTPEDVADLMARYAAGESTRQLATAFELGKSTVLRLLRDNGAPVRQRGQHSRD